MSLNRSALNRGSQVDLLNKLKKSVEPKKSNSYDDPRIWKPSRNEDGVGYAVIRLLPPPEEDGNYIKDFYTHGFKGVGGWYIQNCPTTVEQKCPVCEHNSSLWNSGIEADKNTARQRSRRTQYLTNILVVKDPAHPENEGKNFIWGMGKKLFEKAKAILNPPEEFGEEGKNPWDLFSGLELRLKIKTVAQFPNYDDSQFVETSLLFDGDEEKLEELLRKTYDLDKYVEEVVNVPYAELSRKFAKTIGLTVEEAGDPSDSITEKDIPEELKAKQAPKAEKKETEKSERSDDGEDLMNYFKKLRESA